MFIIKNLEIQVMTDEELKSIESYLNKVFRSEEIVVKKRKSISDSCEIYLDDEFLGLIYKETEEGEEDYQLKDDLKK